LGKSRIPERSGECWAFSREFGQFWPIRAGGGRFSAIVGGFGGEGLRDLGETIGIFPESSAEFWAESREFGIKFGAIPSELSVPPYLVLERAQHVGLHVQGDLVRPVAAAQVEFESKG
jgi:hypothetical protein